MNSIVFSLLFFLYSLETGSGKTYKGSRVNLHVLQEDYSSKKPHTILKGKKKHSKIQRDARIFFKPIAILGRSNNSEIC